MILAQSMLFFGNGQPIFGGAMKKTFLAIAAVLALATIAYGAAEPAALPAPEKGIVVGTAIEISTYATQGMTEKDIAAMVARCEQGFPVGILDEETGEVWVCIFRSNAPASALETGNKHLQEYMGKKVSAQGLKYKAKGVNVIRLAVISEY
jgi:hypothetical protein